MEPSPARAAAAILLARRRKRRLPGIAKAHAPQNLLDAYGIQDRVVDGLGGPALGWKVGCTNEMARTQLGVEEPFRGRVLAAEVLQSPARVSAGNTFMRVIETELAFRLAEDLPLRDAPYDRAGVEPAIAELIPSLEIVDSVWDDWETVGVQHLIADNACHAGLVLGTPSTDWRDLDLAEFEVRARHNDDEPLPGKGGNALGHPLNPVAWLANDLASMGRELKAGEIVSTGVLTGLIFAEAGDHIVSDYGRFGTVELTFTE